MQAEWFVLLNNQPIGPYSKDDLLVLMQQGSLVPTSYVRRLDGPWITVAQAFQQLVASASPAPAATGSQTTIEVQAPLLTSTFSSANAPRYRRTQKSSAANMFVLAATILIGGAAAVYTVKNIRNLFPHNAPTAPEVIVIPAPVSPRTSNKMPRDEATDVEKPKQVPDSRVVAAPPREIPKSVPVPVAPLPPKNADAPKDPLAEAWLTRIREFHLKRDELIVKLNDLQQKIQPLLDEGGKAEKQFKDITRQAKAIDANVRTLQSALKDLDFAKSQNKNVDAQISSVQSRIATQISEYNSLEAQAAPLRIRIDELTRTLAPLKKSQAGLITDADRLRDNLIWHLNPFAAVSPAVSKAAINYFDELSNHESPLDQGWSHFGRGCFAMRNGDSVNAERSFALAIECLPGEATFLAVRGACRAKAGRADEGLQDMIAAAKKDAGNRTVSYMYAIVQCRRGTYSGAEAKLRECVKLDPSYDRAKRFLSLLKSATDDAKVRHSEFASLQANEAIAIAETFNAHFAIASALAESERFDEAVKHTQQAIAGASPTELPWYQESLRLFQAKKPLRIDWKTFDLWAAL